MADLGCPPKNTFQGLSDRHSRLFASYLLNRERGLPAVRNLIRDDIDRFADLGASRYVYELNTILKHFDSVFPRSERSA